MGEAGHTSATREPPLDSLVGAFVVSLGFDEPDRLEFAFEPGRLGAKSPEPGTVVDVTFRGVTNRDAVLRFCFSKRRWKPRFDHSLDQLIAVERLPTGWALRFLRAGRLFIKGSVPSCQIRE